MSTGDDLVSQEPGHTPAHSRLSRSLRQAIQRGEWQAGERLPSEHELMRRYGVSRNTVRRALQTLVATNVVRRRQGAGTYVSPQGFSHVLGDLRGFTELIAERGRVPGLASVEVTEDPHPPHEAGEFLQCDPIWRVTRVQTVDGELFAVSDTWVADELGRRIDPVALRQRVSLYRLLREDLDVTPREATEVIRAEQATPEDAAHLDVPEGTALITIYRWTLERAGSPLEYARSASPGDRYEYVVKLEA